MSDLAQRLAAKLVHRPDMPAAPAPLPQMSREERLIFGAYLAMGALITTFLATTVTLWLAA